MGILSDGKTKLEFSAESEEETIKNNVAQHPVQRGQPIADHTQRESKDWQFSGKLYAANQHEIDVKYQKLLDWQYNGTLLTYNGAIHHNNIIIEELNKTYEDGGFKNALKITLSLKNVNLVSTSFVKATHVGPKTPSKPASPGVYVTVRGGDTYWGWWVKYGTAIQTLRNWNHWPDRRIPIGVRARVK